MKHTVNCPKTVVYCPYSKQSHHVGVAKTAKQPVQFVIYYCTYCFASLGQSK
jgi:hypothetical protein